MPFYFTYVETSDSSNKAINHTSECDYVNKSTNSIELLLMVL
jgi:hypothetical protein